MSLRVNLEHLATSAAQVAGHGEDLATQHVSADNRIAAAEPGWTGRSGEALANRASVWAAKSRALVTRIGEHASDLHTTELAFATMEAMNAQKLSSDVLA